MFPPLRKSANTFKIQKAIGWFPSSILLLFATSTAPALAQSVLVEESFRNPILNPPFAPNWKYGTRDPNNANLEPPCLTAANVQSSPPTSGMGFVPGCRTGATGLTDAQGGALRLTSSRNDQASFIFYNQAIPAGQGLQIIFDFYAYGGREFEGRRGDGISFFLVDGAANPNTAGAFGGSLGYAQKTGINGIEGGYVGIGLDEFGNYSNPGEGRQGGPGIRIDAVALRGRGNGTSGYAYLGGTGTLPGSIDSLTPNANRAASKRTARIILTPDNKISVEINFGSGFQQVIAPFDLAAQGSLPSAGFKFGFASSTGAATNIHEIRNLLITTLSPNLKISKSHTGNFTVGQNGEYTLRVQNSASAGSTSGPVTVTDTLPQGLNFVSASGTNWNCSAVEKTVTCNYTGSPVAPSQTLPDIKLTVFITSTAGAKVTNFATVTTPEDADTTDNTARDETTLIAAPILTSSKSAALVDTNGNGVADAGEVITYSVTINNIGNAASTNTLFTDAIPANTAYVPSSTTLNGAAVADVGGEMPFVSSKAVNSQGEPTGQINAGESAIASFQVTIANPLPTNVTQISNQGTVKSDQVTQPVATDDPTVGGTADPTITPIGSGLPTLKPTKNAAVVDANNNGVADAGEVITYSITINNTGNAVSTNTVFTDPIPANTAYIPNSTTLNGNPVADVTGNMPFTNGGFVNSQGEPNGQINVGKSAIVSFQVRIANPVPTNVTQISNQGTVKTDQATQPVATDDPTVGGTFDPTITPIGKGEARLNLVKRITAIKRDNQAILFRSFINDPTNTNDDPAGWNQLLPAGVPRLGTDQPLQSGDEVEYTIYFLAEGSSPVNNVKVCDLIPTGTTFIPDSFETRKGILVNQSGTETPQTNNIVDTDPGKFFAPMNPVMAPCANSNNPNGAVFVNLGNLASATSNNIGFIRFRVKID